ncbi:MAG: hypothetical protein ABII01_02980 [Candidatus Woesearchaeota archaeon]
MAKKEWLSKKKESKGWSVLIVLVIVCIVAVIFFLVGKNNSAGDLAGEAINVKTGEVEGDSASVLFKDGANIISNYNGMNFNVKDANTGLYHQLILTRGGSLGIGTTNPQAELDVVGDIKSSGTICDGSAGCIKLPLRRYGKVWQNTSKVFIPELVDYEVRFIKVTGAFNFELSVTMAGEGWNTDPKSVTIGYDTCEDITFSNNHKVKICGIGGTGSSIIYYIEEL